MPASERDPQDAQPQAIPSSDTGQPISNAGAPRKVEKGARVLVVDDEPELRRAVSLRLQGEGFVVAGAETGAEGLEMLARWRPDVIILDLSLPDMDGLEVCRQARARSATPIIVLSVRESDDDKVTALESGADDYLTKPFSSRELVARVRLALRHAAQVAGGSGAATEARFQTGGLMIDYTRRLVTVDGKDVHLTPTEYDMLKYLARHAGKVITRRTLLIGVWGPQYATEDHYLHVFVGQLRRKIEPNPSRPIYLLTEPGVGYRLRSPEE